MYCFCFKPMLLIPFFSLFSIAHAFSALTGVYVTSSFFCSFTHSSPCSALIVIPTKKTERSASNSYFEFPQGPINKIVAKELQSALGIYLVPAYPRGTAWRCSWIQVCSYGRCNFYHFALVKPAALFLENNYCFANRGSL